MSTPEDREADALEVAREHAHGADAFRWEGWSDCIHRELCADRDECLKRDPWCHCVVAHDNQTECLQWRRENEGEPDYDGQ